jgi:hypothetical protein
MIKKLVVWLVERKNPGIKRHAQLGSWVRESLDEVNRLNALQRRVINWWDISGRFNSVVVKRIQLRQKYIDWLLDRIEVWQREQEEIGLSWSER